jgi:Ca2+-binding EF-hand superfamily protein
MRILLLCLLACISAQAYALDTFGGTSLLAQSGQMYELMLSRFKQADSNKDSALSRQEAEKMPRVAAHFDEIDLNHDGQVSLTEMQAMFAQKMQQAGK